MTPATLIQSILDCRKKGDAAGEAALADDFEALYASQHLLTDAEVDEIFKRILEAI